MTAPRVLVITGLSSSPLIPLLTELAAAGMHYELVLFSRGKESILVGALSRGNYQACIIPGFGSGTDFKPKRPTWPFVEDRWRKQLTAWVATGGVLLMQGARAAAAVLSTWFCLSWRMESDEHCCTSCQLNNACMLMVGCLVRQVPVHKTWHGVVSVVFWLLLIRIFTLFLSPKGRQ
mmetsp:Transcript_21440/g.36603  ORF Transcript_21440/g.36603 Transcript_21440/m.36603 type:complete len:177 (-) Transcript_21440:87-617(-)